MTEGTYWNGKRWVSADEMAATRHQIKGPPKQPLPPRPPKPQPPKES